MQTPGNQEKVIWHTEAVERTLRDLHRVGSLENFYLAGGVGAASFATLSLVASGSIQPTPEPDTFALLGLGLLAGL